MQNYILWFLSIPFLYWNYKIISSDIKHKKIPNKYLLYLIYLLPIYYLTLYWFFDLNILKSFIQVNIWLLLSFWLFYYWVWSAWDAKYLLVLALYIPHKWIIPFVWNIAVITLIYLIIYFLYFYFVKCLFNRKYFKNILSLSFIDLKDRFDIFHKNSNEKLYKNIAIKKTLRRLILFIIFFVFIRLIRLILMNWIISWDSDLLKDFVSNYHYYLWFSFIWILFLIRLFFRYISKYIRMFLKKYIKIKFLKEKNEILFLIIITLLFFAFLIYEYRVDPINLKNSLYKIFTLYLILFFIFIILKYAYKLTFQVAEQNFININALEIWDIVDKNLLVHHFWTQWCLWYIWTYTEKKEINKRKKFLLFPNPKEYFLKILNPIDEETAKTIKKVFMITNSYHKNHSWFNKIRDLKVLKTFAFWWYIFVWFLITIIFWNKIFTYTINFFIDLYSKIIY